MHALARKLDLPVHAVASGPAGEPMEAGAERAVREIAARFGKLSAEITDIAGRVGDVT